MKIFTNKQIILLILSTYFTLNSIAQGHTTTNLFFIEAGGQGGYGSINYERLIKKNGELHFSARIGLSTYHLQDYTNRFNPDVIIPASLNSYYGNKHNIDLGIGLTFTSIIVAGKTYIETTRKNSFYPSLSVGYRYQKETGGLIFKIGYSPIFENNFFRHWFYIATGYGF